MENLDGKTAVITGTSRGFGLAMARVFLQEGCTSQNLHLLFRNIRSRIKRTIRFYFF